MGRAEAAATNLTARAAQLRYDLPQRMKDDRIDSHHGNTQPKRGLILRLLYRVYTNYLGVTPPTPAQEKVAAVVLIGGVVLGLIAVVGLVFFLWETMTRMGGR
jgi:hypothetical protein